MKSKKIIAGLLALTFVFGGTVSNCAPVISQCITVQAASVEGDCYTFDAETGVLTLRGKVDSYVLKTNKYKYIEDVRSIVAENGTVLPKDCYGLFSYYHCTSIDLSKADTSNVTSMYSMFSNCSNLTKLDLSGFDTRNVTNMESMFSGCISLTELDVSSFDTSNVTNMAGMFHDCKSLTTLDLSGFDTSNITNMDSMFLNCSSLTSLDLSGFDTHNVKSMYRMFECCSSLTSLDLSSFDTSKVESMNMIFYKCYDLLSLDLSGFNTSNVTNMHAMFSCCSSLTTLDLSGFDTRNVTEMSGMFGGCSSLTTLDLGSFDTRNIKGMNNMFGKCESLKTLTLGENYSQRAGTYLPNGDGWVNVNDPTTIVSGDGEYAYFANKGKNTYIRYNANKPTYPTNIKVEYNQIYPQVRFTWDKVENAKEYGIAIYQAGKWRIQKQGITTTSYTTPKNLTPGKSYKVMIAAKVDGEWDTANAIKHAVTISIPENKDSDGDGYDDIYDLDPENKFDYSFLDNEIYVIGMYHDDKNCPFPIEATSDSSVKNSDKTKYDCDNESYFRFKWCGNGYKIYSAKYESNNKVLTINSSGNVVLEEDKDLPSQIWEVLPYGYSKDNLPIDGLRLRSKMWYSPNGKPTSYFLSYDGSKLKASSNDSNNKVILQSPKGWTRFGEMLLNKYGWENTGVSATRALENYDYNINIGISKDNILNYMGHDLLVYQNGGNFPKLNFVEVKMDGVCCEIMGTYNALVLHDEPVDFFKLAVEFEENANGNYYIAGDGICAGWAGSDPQTIGYCLGAYNVNYTTIDLDDYSTYKDACDTFDAELKTGKSGIISYQFPITYLGIHTYAVVDDGRTPSKPILTFNYNCNAKTSLLYPSTYSTLDNGNKHFMIGYVLK